MKKITLTLSLLIFISISVFGQQWWNQGLVAHYALDGNNEKLDSSVNAHNLSSSGNVNYISNRHNHAFRAIDLPTYKAFLTGSSLHLPSGSQARTFSIWINWTNFSSLGYSFVFFYGEQLGYKGQGLGITNNGQVIYAGYKETQAQVADINSIGTIKQNEWVHIGMSYDGDTAKLYINGVLDNKGVRAWNTTVASHLKLEIGRMDATGGSQQSGASYTLPYDGAVDNFRIYDRELSAQEIYKLSQDDFSVLSSGGGGGNVSVSEISSEKPGFYPNPVKDMLYLQSDKHIRKINIYNTNGTLLLQTEDVGKVLNVSKLPAGTYVLGIVYEEGEKFERLIKL